MEQRLAIEALDLSSSSCPLLEERLAIEAAGLVFSSSDESLCSEPASDANVLWDEPEDAKMQLVSLEVKDLLNGRLASNFSFRSLIS